MDFMTNLLEIKYKQLGLIPKENESLLNNLKRVAILEWLNMIGNPKVISDTMDLMRVWMKNAAENPVHVNIRRVTYAIAVKHGGSEMFEFLFQKLNQHSFIHEKEKILAALCQSQHAGSLEKLLKFITENPDGILTGPEISTMQKELSSSR